MGDFNGIGFNLSLANNVKYFIGGSIKTPQTYETLIPSLKFNRQHKLSWCKTLFLSLDSFFIRLFFIIFFLIVLSSKSEFLEYRILPCLFSGRCYRVTIVLESRYIVYWQVSLEMIFTHCYAMWQRYQTEIIKAAKFQIFII